MTEQEWLETNNAYRMLEYVLYTTSTRKLRLFACDCTRRFIRQSHLAVFMKLVEIGERYAENTATHDEVEEGRRLARSRPEYASLSLVVSDDIARVLLTVFSHEYNLTPDHCAVARDIFGNPFRPVTIDPRWLTSTVVDLANAIYDESNFNRMPSLADALVDAGCENEEIIVHCLSREPHVKGCWVVDLLLGKE